MLAELVVSDLGVVEHLSLVLRPGMTAVTGETGAGKTLVVGAIDLLLGGRADPVLVRDGADEARVDGRFVIGDDEVVLSRVVPRSGRSRAYIDGRPVPVSVLADRGRSLVDLHGQHAHQALLTPAAQRRALDELGGISLDALHTARAEVRRLEAALAEMGGDERARARELDLLRYQHDELVAATLGDADEDRVLRDEEELLADASAHRDAAHGAAELISGDDGAADRLGAAMRLLGTRAPFSGEVARLRAAVAEVLDVADVLRRAGDAMEDDPQRLEEIRQRRLHLRELIRKYGEDLAAVIAFRDEAAARIEELVSHDERAAGLESELARARAAERHAFGDVVEARRAVAPRLASAVLERLRGLAMPKAMMEIEVGDVPESAEGDGTVQMLLSANPGLAPQPLHRIASGGELARVMLALRLSLLGSTSADGAPDTLVFDEVDAGIGGETAVAVGRSLASLAAGSQVLVVTHLAQVASCADHQVLVRKEEVRGRTRTTVSPLDHEARVTELARMLSGQPDSVAARSHAEELLAQPTGTLPTVRRAPARARKVS